MAAFDTVMFRGQGPSFVPGKLGQLGGSSLRGLSRLPRQMTKYGRRIEHRLLRDTEALLDRADEFDEHLSKITHLWRFRIDRILTPNFVNHIHAVSALVLNVLQVLIIFEMIHSSHGHIGKIPSIQVILLPTYVHIALRLAIQMTVLVFVLHRALHVEAGHLMLVHFREVGSLRPVLEQLIPVGTYTLMFCTALAIGFCHISDVEAHYSLLCSSFNIPAIKGIVATYAVLQTAHHLIAIYHARKHAEVPRPKGTGFSLGNGGMLLNQEKKLAARQRPGSVDDRTSPLEWAAHFDEDMTHAWNWWKYRMNRILGASVAHHVCRMIDVILESVTVVLLVSAVHQSQGNLQNLRSIGSIFIPIYIKLFGKALVQLVSFAYYCSRNCGGSIESDFSEVLHEPSAWVKPVEHAIPFLAYSVMGVTALAVGYCHLDITDQRWGLCKAFPYGVVKGVVVGASLCQMLHHFVALYHHHAFSSKPRMRKETNEQIPMSETSSHYGQLR